MIRDASMGMSKILNTASGVLSGGNSMAYAVKNPTTFIYSGTSWMDWYCTGKSNQNNDLWGNVSGTKTVYDPCPRGWRIPPYQTWYDFAGLDNPRAPDMGEPYNSIKGQGTFVFYTDGEISNVEGKVTCGRLYRNGISTTVNPQPIAWYPIAGYISYGDGNLIFTGGYTWSSGTSGEKAVYCYFQAIRMSNARPSARGWGIQVRCIQE